MLCSECRDSALAVERLAKTPWSALIAEFEFMIAYSSFQRHFDFYSSMDKNQMMKAYAKVVSSSPARIMQAYMQADSYSQQSADEIPENLQKGLSLMLNGAVSQQLITYCIEASRSHCLALTALAAMTSAELVRMGPLKYIAPLKVFPQAPGHRRVIVSMAVIAWRRELNGYSCNCGAWEQACATLSSMSPDMESTLVIQDEVTPCRYICILLCISPPPDSAVVSATVEMEDPVDYRYLFRDLLICNMIDPTINR